MTGLLILIFLVTFSTLVGAVAGYAAATHWVSAVVASAVTLGIMIFVGKVQDG